VLTQQEDNLGSDSRSVRLRHRDRIDTVDGDEKGKEKGAVEQSPPRPRFET
jgi:hypothetical protein